jgi:two-component system, response regulator PdtaR
VAFSLDPIPKEERRMQAAAPSVLTVEGDPTVRADLRLVLEDAGFDVVAQAGDGDEAVELAREHQPDVIVRGVDEPDPVIPRRVPIVALPATFSQSEVVDAISAALTRNASLRTIESLVGELSFATPEPSELEQASWERGHVWRRVDSPEDVTG